MTVSILVCEPCANGITAEIPGDIRVTAPLTVRELSAKGGIKCDGCQCFIPPDFRCCFGFFDVYADEEPKPDWYQRMCVFFDSRAGLGN